MPRSAPLNSFDLAPGRRLGPRYVIERLLGRGSEGEVYHVRDRDTGISRAAKLYFPHRDPKHKLSIRHAQKLDTLRGCPIVLQYHHSEMLRLGGRRNPMQVIALISELAQGEPLQAFIERQEGERLPPYMALHVLFELVKGLEMIHGLGEYHADVHTQNILIQPAGVRFDLKLIDFYDWGRPAKYKREQDLRDAIRVFYDCLGGRTAYREQPPPVKHIVAGLRHDLIRRRFPDAASLRRYLQTFPWQRLG